jgi:hypothetical protein
MGLHAVKYLLLIGFAPRRFIVKEVLKVSNGFIRLDDVAALHDPFADHDLLGGFL